MEIVDTVLCFRTNSSGNPKTGLHIIIGKQDDEQHQKCVIHFCFIDPPYLVSLKKSTVDSVIDVICLKAAYPPSSYPPLIHHTLYTLLDKCTVLSLLHPVVQNDIMQDLILYVWSIYIWSMVMSRCLIISQAYKRAIGLPVAAVILIDGGQVGATVLPSHRLFIYTVYRLPTLPTTGLHSLNLQSSGEKKIC